MEIFAYIIVAVIVIAFYVLIIRAVFRIDTLAENLIEQTKLLKEIARKQGVDPDNL